MTTIERLRAIGAELDEYECPTCCAFYEANTTYPWHLPDEDCRAIREPLTEAELASLKAWPADTPEQLRYEQREMLKRWGVSK
jgi:hypothetical protein